MQQLVGFLADPTVRILITLVGGFLIKRVPWLENKGIPIILQGGNLLITVLGLLLGVQFAPIGPISRALGEALQLGANWIVPAAYAGGVTAAIGGLLFNPIADSIVTTFTASGLQSQVKNVLQLARAGWRFLIAPAPEK